LGANAGGEATKELGDLALFLPHVAPFYTEIGGLIDNKRKLPSWLQVRLVLRTPPFDSFNSDFGIIVAHDVFGLMPIPTIDTCWPRAKQLITPF
jgi:hypothetical protein